MTDTSSERGEFVESGIRRRGWAIVAAGSVLIAASVVAVASGVFAAGRTSSRSGSGTSAATSLATVTRQSLSTQTQLTGTLGYAGSYAVLGQMPGTVTWLPSVGQVIGDGQMLYRVDGAPVVLLYGATPAYRTLAAGLTGADVSQLNHDLVALGYADQSDVDATWNEFSWATRAGVEKLQNHLGVDRTGSLALGTVVFLPSAARVTTLSASLGGPATGPVITATSTVRTVSVALATDLQPAVKAGEQVTITLPNNSTTPGRVISVGTVATLPANNSGSSDSAPTVPLTIRLTNPAATGRVDQAPVVVSVTGPSVRDVLAVPVNALIARAGGEYAVEVAVSDGTHRLVQVTTGLFDDAAGMVQVSGSGLRAGQHVVVPGQ